MDLAPIAPHFSAPTGMSGRHLAQLAIVDTLIADLALVDDTGSVNTITQSFKALASKRKQWRASSSKSIRLS
jgi:hypothetical protein